MAPMILNRCAMGEKAWEMLGVSEFDRFIY